MGLFDDAKDMATNPENTEKLRGLASEENVDAAADKAKDLAPDKADDAIDDLADKAKGFGQNQ